VRPLQSVTFLRRRIVVTSPNNRPGGPPLIGCPRLLIHYIRSYPSHIETVPPARTWRSAILWWLDHTYHGLVGTTGSKIVWNCKLWWSPQFSDEDGARYSLMFEGKGGKWIILTGFQGYMHYFTNILMDATRHNKLCLRSLVAIDSWIDFISVINQLDAQNLFHNKFYFMPLHVWSTCARDGHL